MASRPRVGEKVTPRLGTQLGVLCLVELRESRCEPGFDGPLAKEVGAEGMNRAGDRNRSRLPSARRRHAPTAPAEAGTAASPSSSRAFLQRELKTAAQLRGGLARERDGGHVLDLIPAGRDARPPSAQPSCASCLNRRPPRRAGCDRDPTTIAARDCSSSEQRSSHASAASAWPPADRPATSSRPVRGRRTRRMRRRGHKTCTPLHPRRE